MEYKTKVFIGSIIGGFIIGWCILIISIGLSLFGLLISCIL